MPINIDIGTSALSTALQNSPGYNAADVILYKQKELRQDKLIEDQRKYDALNKMYDTSLQVLSTDWGVYQDEVIKSYNEGLAKATEQIKNGVNPIETISNYTLFSSNVSKVNKLKENELKFATFVDKNEALSPEAKKKIIEDRAKSVNLSEDGEYLDIEEALNRSESYEFDIYKYMDEEDIAKSYLTEVKSSTRVSQSDKGYYSYTVMPWQDVDKDGKVSVKVATRQPLSVKKDGQELVFKTVTEDVYNQFMLDDNRKGFVESRAKQMAEELGTKNISDIETLKRVAVSELITPYGEQGSTSSFTQYKIATTKPSTEPDYTATFAMIEAISPPTASEAKDFSTINSVGKKETFKGRDITGEVRGVLGEEITSAFIGVDGKIYVAKSYIEDAGGNKFPVYVSYADKKTLILSTDNQKLKAQYEKRIAGGVTSEDLSSYVGKATNIGTISSIKATSNGKVMVEFTLNNITTKKEITKESLNSILAPGSDM